MLTVPSRPSECSALPLYTSAGDLAVVHLIWGIVDVCLLVLDSIILCYAAKFSVTATWALLYYF